MSILEFRRHPWAGTDVPMKASNGETLTVSFPVDAFAARTAKYSFLITYEPELGGWFTSWQDQVNGGSASSTKEGPFKDRFAAEANCRRTLKQLERKN